MSTNRKISPALVAVTSTSLLLGALGFQAWGYPPCEMCLWQRWPHAAAATAASAALLLRGRSAPFLAVIAILSLMSSGIIGFFHAGVEWKLWEGISTCSSPVGGGSGGDVFLDIMNAPLIRCDEAAWRLFGISMAGYNAIISLGMSCIAAHLLLKNDPATTRKKKV